MYEILRVKRQEAGIVARSEPGDEDDYDDDDDGTIKLNTDHYEKRSRLTLPAISRLVPGWKGRCCGRPHDRRFVVRETVRSTDSTTTTTTGQNDPPDRGYVRVYVYFILAVLCPTELLHEEHCCRVAENVYLCPSRVRKGGLVQWR